MRRKKEQKGEAPRQEQQQILPRPSVWQRRQMPSQQVPIRPAPMEGVERTNVVIVRGLGQGAETPPRRDPYVMEVDRRRNCYACGGFGHIAYHCRNRRRIAEGRRVEFEENYEYLNTLKGE